MASNLGSNAYVKAFHILRSRLAFTTSWQRQQPWQTWLRSSLVSRSARIAPCGCRWDLSLHTLPNTLAMCKLSWAWRSVRPCPLQAFHLACAHQPPRLRLHQRDTPRRGQAQQNQSQKLHRPSFNFTGAGIKHRVLLYPSCNQIFVLPLGLGRRR